MNEALCKTITILSIDGGGIRGIIPALVLKELEHRLNCVTNCKVQAKPLASYFDIMAGTSTGGIIVLLLNATEDGKTPKFTITQVIDFYKQMGTKVFNKSFWSLSGWTGDKYKPDIFEGLLKEYFDDLSLKNTLTNIIIPAFDIAQQKMIFFRSSLAKADPDRNYYLRDVARGTSAAPTYFPPAIIYSTERTRTNILVDGGVSANNPALCAAIHALDLYGRDINLVVISIGTGNVSASEKSALSGTKMNIHNMGMITWAPIIVPTMMDSSNDIVDYQMQHVVNKNYYRLQIDMNPEDSALDNVTEENLDQLEFYAQYLIERHSDTIDEIVKVLVSLKN